MAKWGEGYAEHMFRKGLVELQNSIVPDSNIAASNHLTLTGGKSQEEHVPPEPGRDAPEIELER